MATTHSSKAKKQTPTQTKAAGLPSIEFSLVAPDAKEVVLVGDFNNWNGEGYRMKKSKDGICKKKVDLKPGRYEYRFIVDGNWWTDPKANETCLNSFGSQNSVINIQ
jgi:1,4-alpha-glucan branching enzyme